MAFTLFSWKSSLNEYVLGKKNIFFLSSLDREIFSMLYMTNKMYIIAAWNILLQNYIKGGPRGHY